MDILWHLVQVGFLVLVTPQISWTFDCVTPTKDPNAPPLPFIPGASYQAYIELNFIHKNKTWTMEEYLDYNGNRGARIISKDDSAVKYIYSFSTNEIFVLQDTTCRVVNMSSQEGQSLSFAFGSKLTPQSSDKRHVFGAAATFRYARDNSNVFAGQDVVRGIPANKWSTCITTGQDKMQITYFFNVPQWDMQLTGLTLPLRIEVEGTAPNSGATGSHYFHHVYDFIKYAPTISIDPSMFETPTNVVCSGRSSTKSLPVFDKRFQYVAEDINALSSAVTHYKVWYDGLSKLVRIDKRDTAPQPPVYTTNPVTEIHDYNTGIRYIRDNILGNCSIHPLSGFSTDSVRDPQRTIEMSDPNRFFTFTKNYIYTGTRTLRGMLCDVYSATIPNYNMDGITANATFHYYFLSDTWDDLPLEVYSTDSKNYPVHLEIELDKLGSLNKIINFFDFDESLINADVFDVSDCFDDRNKIKFRLVFPGTFYPPTKDEWKYDIRNKIAEVIQLSPSRVGNVAISANLHNVFVTGYLLGTTSSAQFEIVSQVAAERVADKTFPSVKVLANCADLCVGNKDFLCQGYQYCPDSSCGLSKFHVMNQTIKTGGQKCSFYTRTIVKSDVKEESLSDAYTLLDVIVKSKALNLNIQNPDNYGSNYVAIDLQKLSGYSNTQSPMPSLSSQFSYRMETVVQEFALVFDSYVWYDYDLKFVRLDSRSEVTSKKDEHSIISDFNLGISYKIDKVTNECQILPISKNNDFDVNTFASKADKNGGLQIKMKSPLEMFYIDKSYQYMGQKTVRGILCDVYQAERSDFHIHSWNLTTEISIFTLYFQAENWGYLTANSLDITKSQPVQVTIEDTSAETMLMYNIFDYDDEHHTFSYYDVSTCYGPDQSKSFEIIFKDQPFHPTLDAAEPTFLNTAILIMAEITELSPIHFVKTSVSYDDSNVYLLVTALGTVSPQYLFQPVTKVSLKPAAKPIYASTYIDCAAACSDISNPCNSFDFCPDDTNPKCLLITTRDDYSPISSIDPNGACTHYSRSDNSMHPMLSVEKIYQAVTDMVYKNLFQITINLPGGKNKTYTATDIRDDIFRSTDPASSPGSLLKKFTLNQNKQLPKSAIVETHTMMSITDCVLSCVSTTTLYCQSFDYSFDVGTCRLSNKHLDEITTLLTKATNINTYGVLYTKDFTKQDGYVFSDQPDKAISQVTSSELCARSCDAETSFKCESFEYCPNDKSCNLRKTHKLPSNQSDSGKIPSCIHYSREHLYDYTKRSQSIIKGHDDLILSVGSASECAQHCAHGELDACASFEVCDVSRGETTCTLSKADPTLQSDLTISNSLQCNLYTKSNPAQRIKPSPPKPTTSAPNTVNSDKQTSSDDTGARVGIAFSMLFLGCLVGALAVLFYMKWWIPRRTVDEDSQQLDVFQ